MKSEERKIQIAKQSAKQWSLDPDNLIGQAVVIRDPSGQLSVCTDFRGEWDVIAKFIDGYEED